MTGAAPAVSGRGAFVARPGALVAGVIVAGTVVRLAVGALTGLGVDESYMVVAGRRLAAGYLDHPPAAWWLSWAAAHMAGSEAAIVVRLPFIALFALSTWLMYRLTASLFTPAAGGWAALFLNLSPVLALAAGGWVLPDGPLDCALLGFALCLVHAMQERSGWRWWLGAGLCAGLAMDSKYNAVLPLAGAALYLATAPRHRFWLARPQPYAAVTLALAVFAPVMLWNAAHGWASFAFQGDRAGGARLHPFGPPIVFAGEALFLFPWLWVRLMMAFAGAARQGPRAWPGWFACCLGALPVLGFAGVALWAPHVLYHWAAPGYMMLFPLLGMAAARDDVAGLRWPRWMAWGSAAVMLCGVAVLCSEAQLGWQRGLIAVAPGGMDPNLETTDWRSLGPDLRARGLLGPGAVVAAVNWHDAGKLGIALGPRVPILCVCADARQFGLRPLAPAATVLMLAPRQDAGRVASEFGWHFASLWPLAPVSVRQAGAPVMPVAVLLGRKFSP